MNTTLPLFRKTLLLITFGLSCVSAQAAMIISLNVRDANASGNAAINGSETFGIAALGTDVGNWNNTNSFGAAAPLLNLQDNSANVTGVSVVAANSGGTNYWGATYVNTAWNFGVTRYSTTVGGNVSLSFSNLNATFSNGFYAIVYVNGAEATQGAAITDGSTTYFFKPSSPASLTPILITDTNSGDGYSVGNYAVFGSTSAPITSDSITFSIPNGSVLSNNAGIGGVQLVAVPEPGTAAVFAGLAVLGLLLLRRRHA